MYTKNAIKIPFTKIYEGFNKVKTNEIIITPELPEYTITENESPYIKGKTDFIITFLSNNVAYKIILMYFPINNLETYNVVFTTSEQWAMYEFKLKLFGKKGFITVEEYTILNKIIGEETKLNDLFHIMKKITGILLDFHSSRIPNKLLSIGDTDNKKKINFTNIKESEDIVDGHKYFIYEIK